MRIDLGQDESSSSCESESGYMTLTLLWSLQGVEVLLGDSPGAEKGQGPMNQSRTPSFYSMISCSSFSPSTIQMQWLYAVLLKGLEWLCALSP